MEKKCVVCFKDGLCDPIGDETSLGKILERHVLTHICQECFQTVNSLFENDKPMFIKWIVDHDRRKTGDEIILSMRGRFGVNEDILMENPSDYYNNLETYSVYLENLFLNGCSCAETSNKTSV
jgi:hypothetical protein